MLWFSVFLRWALTVGGIGVVALTTHGLWRGWRARRWPAVIGEVTESRAHYERGGPLGGGYLPDVLYRYELNGVMLTGSRVTFSWRRIHKTERGAKRSLRGMEPGTSVPVYYNPRRPSDAVLRPGPSFADLFALIGGAGLFFIGLQLK